MNSSKNEDKGEKFLQLLLLYIFIGLTLSLSLCLIIFYCSTSYIETDLELLKDIYSLRADLNILQETYITSNNNFKGEIEIEQTANGVVLIGKLEGLEAGSEHSISVIEFADFLPNKRNLKDDTFTIYSPDLKEHDCSTEDINESYYGDFGHLIVNNMGVSIFTITKNIIMKGLVGRMIVITKKKTLCDANYLTIRHDDVLAFGLLRVIKPKDLKETFDEKEVVKKQVAMRRNEKIKNKMRIDELSKVSNKNEENADQNTLFKEFSSMEAAPMRSTTERKSKPMFRKMETSSEEDNYSKSNENMFGELKKEENSYLKKENKDNKILENTNKTKVIEDKKDEGFLNNFLNIFNFSKNSNEEKKEKNDETKIFKKEKEEIHSKINSDSPNTKNTEVKVDSQKIEGNNNNADKPILNGKENNQIFGILDNSTKKEAKNNNEIKTDKLLTNTEQPDTFFNSLEAANGLFSESKNSKFEDPIIKSIGSSNASLNPPLTPLDSLNKNDLTKSNSNSSQNKSINETIPNNSSKVTFQVTTIPDFNSLSSPSSPYSPPSSTIISNNIYPQTPNIINPFPNTKAETPRFIHHPKHHLSDPKPISAEKPEDNFNKLFNEFFPPAKPDAHTYKPPLKSKGKILPYKPKYTDHVYPNESVSFNDNLKNQPTKDNLFEFPDNISFLSMNMEPIVHGLIKNTTNSQRLIDHLDEDLINPYSHIKRRFNSNVKGGDDKNFNSTRVQKENNTLEFDERSLIEKILENNDKLIKNRKLKNGNSVKDEKNNYNYFKNIDNLVKNDTVQRLKNIPEVAKNPHISKIVNAKDNLDNKQDIKEKIDILKKELNRHIE